jgi:16S rRNA (uracil1498-N3)-methyltransferase
MREGQIAVSSEKFRHARTVLRVKAGEAVEVVDGRGGLFRGIVSLCERERFLVEVKQAEHVARPKLKVVLAPSLTRQQNMNLMIEKLSELGVDEIRPLICQRSDVSFSVASWQRWQRIAIQSLKVNHRLWLTEVFQPIAFQDVLTLAAGFPTRLALEIQGKTGMLRDLPFPVFALVGPPGDFAAVERECLLEWGFTPVQINAGVLKTETAAIAAAAILLHD